jgi:hypothetical protein
MQTSDHTDSEALVIQAEGDGTRADPQHIVELIAAMSAQRDSRWRLELVAPRYTSYRSWNRIVASQPTWIRERVLVCTRSRGRRRIAAEADLHLRIDDVPLEHLVETVLSRSRNVRFPVVIQPVTRTRWPRNSSGWTVTGPPTPQGGTYLTVGSGRVLVEDFLVLRREWM